MEVAILIGRKRPTVPESIKNSVAADGTFERRVGHQAA